MLKHEKLKKQSKTVVPKLCPRHTKGQVKISRHACCAKYPIRSIITHIICKVHNYLLMPHKIWQTTMLLIKYLLTIHLKEKTKLDQIGLNHLHSFKPDG